MAAAVPTTFRCRGLRKWCGRRCEATTGVEPRGYPQQGFYCTLHTYQRPRAGEDATLAFDTPQVEEHIRRRTSFVSPETTMALEMMKAPGLVKDRPSAGRCVAGLQLVNWLKDKNYSDEAAVACAQRMIALDILVPLSGEKAFVPDSKAFYRVVPQLPKPGGA